MPGLGLILMLKAHIILQYYYNVEKLGVACGRGHLNLTMEVFMMVCYQDS